MATDHHHLKSPVFGDADVGILDRAFKLAWDRFLRTGMMNEHNLSEAQQFIAQRIIDSAAAGEREPWRLARGALFQLWELKFSGEPLMKVAPRRHRRK